MSHKAQLLTTAQLQRATGYSGPAISEMSAIGIIKPAKRGYWSAVETMGAMIRKLRTAASGGEDRARLAKENADNAELEGMKLRGEVVMLDAAKAWWADGRIEIKRTVERAEFLTPTQKTRLLTVLSKIRTKGP